MLLEHVAQHVGATEDRGEQQRPIRALGLSRGGEKRRGVRFVASTPWLARRFDGEETLRPRTVKAWSATGFCFSQTQRGVEEGLREIANIRLTLFVRLVSHVRRAVEGRVRDERAHLDDVSLARQRVKVCL